MRTTCRQCADDVCMCRQRADNVWTTYVIHQPKSPTKSRSHVIRTSSACHLHVVCTRFQPQIYFPLKSIAGTALLKIKKRNLLIVTELVVSGTQCILVVKINWEDYIKNSRVLLFFIFQGNIWLQNEICRILYYVSRFELYKLKGVHYETSGGSRFSQKRGCQP